MLYNVALNVHLSCFKELQQETQASVFCMWSKNTRMKFNQTLDCLFSVGGAEEWGQSEGDLRILRLKLTDKLTGRMMSYKQAETKHFWKV